MRYVPIWPAPINDGPPPKGNESNSLELIYRKVIQFPVLVGSDPAHQVHGILKQARWHVRFFLPCHDEFARSDFYLQDWPLVQLDDVADRQIPFRT